MILARVSRVVQDRDLRVFVEVLGAPTGLSCITLLVEGDEGVLHDRNIASKAGQKEIEPSRLTLERFTVFGDDGRREEPVRDQNAFPAVLHGERQYGCSGQSSVVDF